MSFTVTTFTIDFEFASSFTFADFFAFFKAFGGVFISESLRALIYPMYTSLPPAESSFPILRTVILSEAKNLSSLSSQTRNEWLSTKLHHPGRPTLRC